MHQRIDHISDLLFPVRKVPVYADLRSGAKEGLRLIPGKHAIVNCDTDEAISVVSDTYQIVTNDEALQYAQLCCKTAFPEAEPRQWRVQQACAPQTMGSCRIDLVHPTSALNFGGPRLGGKPDTYGPFVRVTNSYNRSLALRFEIGFFRKVCSNGMILPKASIRFAFNHNTRKISERVKFKVRKDSFKQLREEFQTFLEPLLNCKVPLKLFVPCTRAALRIDQPEPMADRQREPWERLADSLKSISEQYSSNLGENGYALLNVITDVASRPPKSPFVRREQHSLQRSAGSWLADFSSECRKPGFDFTAYIAGLRHGPSGRLTADPDRGAPPWA